MKYTPREIRALMAHLTPEERDEIEALVAYDIAEHPWRSLPGPQLMAYNSLADIIGFGGAAGGGKTDLACGKATTQHSKCMIMRRESTQLMGITDRLTQILGSTTGYNSQKNVWRPPSLPGVQIEFGSVPHAGDETGYQGRDHDLLVFDEAVNFLESQVRFLLGWLRSTKVGQRCQALLTFNPPTTAEGRWIVQFFAPWLDRKFPNPAKPGELRWAAQIPAGNGTSRDVWLEDGRQFVLVDGEPCFDFDPEAYAPEDIVTPMTRTFIPSRITDNPHLMGTGYLAQLQALPEPLRSQMLYGDFQAGMTDDPWQVIPTAWVEAAQARWKPRSPRGEMLTMGVDVARGGKDATVLSPKFVGNWYGELVKIPGKESPDGAAVVGHVIAHARDQAPLLIDVIGVGASPFDILKTARQDVHGINVAEKSLSKDKSGRLTFFNLRSELWWKMREDLDPVNDTGIALPPDPELLADLCAPRWELRGMTIQVESREEIVHRIKRSPDKASALILARIPMPKRRDLQRDGGNAAVMNYDPMIHVSPNSYETHDAGTLDYDPMQVV